jgi:hypothetical protein
MNFLWGGQEIPPLKALGRMVQHLCFNLLLMAAKVLYSWLFKLHQDILLQR